jgi:hypothetical protein
MKHSAKKQEGRQYWLWIGKPKNFYVNGRPSLHLVDGWHTCHKDTKRGDLALRWLTTPFKQIAYLLQAKSDAYDLSTNSRAKKMAWPFGCDFHVVSEFRKPLTLNDIRADPYLEDWNALRANFFGTAFKMSPELWRKLNRHLSHLNPGHRRILNRVQQGLSRAIVLEEQLEERLVNNLRLLKPFGFDMSLYNDGVMGISGRQLVCRGQGGRIDLLCQSKTKRRYIVIELKNVMATRETYGQVKSYVGWVRKNLAKNAVVQGLVIARGCDVKFRNCLEPNDRIRFVDLTELGFR